MKFLSEAGDIVGPARALEGRFHYNGQQALYLSETPKGCVIATAAYFKDDDGKRAIFPLQVSSSRIVDLRDKAATRALGIDTTHRAAKWREIRAEGARSPTWNISDRVRDLGLDGMFYASRSDPGLTHLTLFRWNELGGASVATDGEPQSWP